VTSVLAAVGPPSGDGPGKCRSRKRSLEEPNSGEHAGHSPPSLVWMVDCSW